MKYYSNLKFILAFYTYYRPPVLSNAYYKFDTNSKTTIAFIQLFLFVVDQKSVKIKKIDSNSVSQ